MYESADGGWAIAWEIAWDTEEDAADFLARARQLQDTLDGEALVTPQGADRVVILVAHDQATLDALGMPYGALRSGSAP
jgi:broad specificity phosphatase PhoE